MLRPRITPCLLVREKGLVKTVGFSGGKYVGDPINVVKIFNEKEVDELIVLDIGATTRGDGPDYRMIEQQKYELIRGIYPLIAEYIMVNLDPYVFARRGQEEKIAAKEAALKNVGE